MRIQRALLIDHSEFIATLYVATKIDFPLKDLCYPIDNRFWKSCVKGALVQGIRNLRSNFTLMRFERTLDRFGDKALFLGSNMKKRLDIRLVLQRNERFAIALNL